MRTLADLQFVAGLPTDAGKVLGMMEYRDLIILTTSTGRTFELNTKTNDLTEVEPWMPTKERG